MGEFEQFFPSKDPQFDSEEQKRLEFLKFLEEKGKIGGLEDKLEREFILHPEIPEAEQLDPSWKNIGPEIKEELFRILGAGHYWRDGELVFVRRWEIKVEQALRFLSERTGAALRGEKPLPEWPEGFYTNTSKDKYSPVLIVAKLIQKNDPQSGLEVKNEAKDLQGMPVAASVGIWIKPERLEAVASKIAAVLERSTMQALIAAVGYDYRDVVRHLAEAVHKEEIDVPLASGIVTLAYERARNLAKEVIREEEHFFRLQEKGRGELHHPERARRAEAILEETNQWLDSLGKDRKSITVSEIEEIAIRFLQVRAKRNT